MAFTRKEHEQEARERLRAFWAGSSLGRPALHLTARNPDFHQENRYAGVSQRVLDYDPAWHAACADYAMRGKIYLAEAMPVAVPTFASNFGALVVMAGGDYAYHDSAWTIPIPDLYDRPLPVFDPSQPFVTMMTGALHRMAAVVSDQGAVNPPTFLDGLTVLSNLRTMEHICFDLIEQPETVHRWRDAITQLYIDAYEYFYQVVHALGYGETTTWLAAMAEGRMEAVQCDFGVTLSPEMYGEFAIPELRRLTDYLDYSLYQLDGTSQLRFLDLLRTLPKLNGIQWNPQPGAGPLVQWIDAFKEIRRRNFSLHIHCEDLEEAVVITRELGPDGLLFDFPMCDTWDEAEQILRRIEQVC
jgi:hypothetical protein